MSDKFDEIAGELLSMTEMTGWPVKLQARIAAKLREVAKEHWASGYDAGHKPQPVAMPDYRIEHPFAKKVAP